MLFLYKMFQAPLLIALPCPLVFLHSQKQNKILDLIVHVEERGDIQQQK